MATPTMLRAVLGLPTVGGLAKHYGSARAYRVLALAALPAPVWAGSHNYYYQATHQATLQRVAVGHRGVLRASPGRRHFTALVVAHTLGSSSGYRPCVACVPIGA